MISEVNEGCTVPVRAQVGVIYMVEDCTYLGSILSHDGKSQMSCVLGLQGFTGHWTFERANF